MMTDLHYPVIDIKTIKSLETIRMLFSTNPTYFNSPSCPYPQSLKDLFVTVAKKELDDKYSDFDTHVSDELPDTDSVVKQINQINMQLRSYWQQIRNNADSSEKNTYFRISTTVIEKLINLKKEALRIKEYEVFVATVLDVMDKELTVDQRNVVMDRLKNNLGGVLTDDDKQGIEEDTTETLGFNKNEDEHNDTPISGTIPFSLPSGFIGDDNS